jgi:hypothetical protein
MFSRNSCFWNDEKDEQLRRERGLSFEDVMSAIEDGRVLADSPHPNRTKHPNQRVLVVEIGGYACAVPYVTDAGGLFLKTIYRSRKLQQLYFARRRT